MTDGLLTVFEEKAMNETNRLVIRTLITYIK